MLLLYLVCIILLALLNSVLDYARILIGKKIFHSLESLIRGAIITIISWTISSTLLKLGLTFAVGAVVFWIVFEIFLNILRGRPLLYVGITAWSDK